MYNDYVGVMSDAAMHQMDIVWQVYVIISVILIITQIITIYHIKMIREGMKKLTESAKNIEEHRSSTNRQE